MTIEITTSNVYPPIPIREFDWCAYFDGEEETGRYGWGVTEASAIKDLRQRYEDEQMTHKPIPALLQWLTLCDVIKRAEGRK